MDGTNAAGRKVSLLNDNGPPPQLVRLPSITPSLRSRTSSYTSSPIGSPPTPQLVRSNSSDSNMQTPSPITPDFGFDLQQPMESPVFAQQSGFFPPQQQKDMHSAYPPLQQPTGALPYHPANPAQGSYFSTQQPAADQRPSSSQAAGPASRPKKNSYPCPMAKQYNCHDYFTTSGHAARHAKKHTGKKDAYCPECNKAFTRKDNMEQHRRTHQSGRNSAKGVEREVKRAKQQAKRPKPAPLQSSATAVPLSMVDPALPTSPAASILAAPAVQPTDPYSDFVHRSPYPDPTPYSLAHPSDPSMFYGGLDALAIAASGEKRKYELE